MKFSKFYLLLIISFLFGLSEHYVFDVNISGNSTISTESIIDILKLKPRTLFTKSEFSHSKLNRDILLIKYLYRSNGFLDVTINKNTENMDENNLVINYEINEGPEYYLNKIKIEGNKKFSDKKIIKLLNLKFNEIYNPIQLRNNIKLLKNEYLNNGKINISIIDEIEKENNHIYLRISFFEGNVYKISDIHFIGLEDIKLKYVEREINFLKGNIYNKDQINKSKRFLFDTQLFSSVEIIPKIISNNQVDLHVRLREFFKSKAIAFDFGFSQLPSENIDLPISAINGTSKWELGNIFNTSSNVSISGEMGVSYESASLFTRRYFDISYFTPWTLFLRIPSRIKLYHEYIFYQEGYMLKNGVNLAFLYSNNNKLVLRSGLVAELIKYNFSEEPINESRRMYAGFSNHNIQKLINPSSGYYYSLSSTMNGTILGGTNNFIRIDSEIKGFYSIIENYILANRIQIGVIIPTMNDKIEDIPEYDLYHLGGSTSLRGWSQENYEDGLGKNMKFLINSELRFPIYKLLGMEVFYDGGALIKNFNEKINYHWDIGIGLTFNTQLGPARIDYALPQGKNPYNIVYSLLYMF